MAVPIARNSRFHAVVHTVYVHKRFVDLVIAVIIFVVADVWACVVFRRGVADGWGVRVCVADGVAVLHALTLAYFAGNVEAFYVVIDLPVAVVIDAVAGVIKEVIVPFAHDSLRGVTDGEADRKSVV